MNKRGHYSMHHALQNKKGQIFVFAAVIISVIVMSMAGITNYAKTTKEPTSFYDYTLDVQREAGLVVDYEIYTGFGPRDDIEHFVNLMIAELKDKDKNTNFMFIYGNKKNVTLRNYGADVANAFINNNEQSIPIKGIDLNIKSTVSIGNSHTEIEGNYEQTTGGGGRADFKASQLGQDIEQVEVTILKNEYNFPLTQHQQVIFLIQKNNGEERYISV